MNVSYTHVSLGQNVVQFEFIEADLALLGPEDPPRSERHVGPKGHPHLEDFRGIRVRQQDQTDVPRHQDTRLHDSE